MKGAVYSLEKDKGGIWGLHGFGRRALGFLVAMSGAYALVVSRELKEWMRCPYLDSQLCRKFQFLRAFSFLRSTQRTSKSGVVGSGLWSLMNSLGLESLGVNGFGVEHKQP